MSDSGERSYTNGEITVFWNDTVCIHSGNCVRHLPKVFDPRRRPWIDLSPAETDQICAAVDDCPSGALHWQFNWELGQHEAPVQESGVRIRVQKNGSLVVKGTVTIENSDGTIIEKKGTFSLCRCGHSKEKPFCDGSHDEFGFKG